MAINNQSKRGYILKKIFSLLFISMLCFSYISCSDSGSSSSLTDQERSEIMMAAFSASQTAVLSMPMESPALSQSQSRAPLITGIVVTGEILEESFDVRIEFTDYEVPDSNIILNGTYDFTCSAADNFTMNGNMSITYNGQEYSFTFNVIINLDTGVYSGSISVDGETYTL